MTRNGQKLTNAYERARIKNRNWAVKQITQAVKDADADDIRGSADNLVADTVSTIYEARKNDEFLAKLYFSMLHLFETGQAPDDYVFDPDEVLSIALSEE